MTPAQRAAFAGLAEVLIPAAHGMPSAGDVDLAGAPLDRVLRARPDLAAPLASLMDSLPDQASGAVAPGLPAAALELLMVVAGGAYTLDPRVRARLGYPGQEAQLLPRAGFGAEDLVVEMLDLPPRWRDPDGTAA